MFLSYPWFLYINQNLTEAVFRHSPSVHQLRVFSLGQSIILFAISLLCSLVGLLYSDRLDLPGLCNPGDVKKWLPTGLVLGLLLTPISYLATDRSLLFQVPEMFPKPWPWALAWMAGSSLAQEVVARLGLLTIGIYLLRWFSFKGHPWPAIAVVSIFASMSTFITYLDRLKLDERLLPWQLWFSLISIFFFQWIFSEVYVRRGFVAVLLLHFGLSIRVLIYSFLF